MTWFAIVYADYTDEEWYPALDCGIEGIYDSEEDARRILECLYEENVHDLMKIESW